MVINKVIANIIWIGNKGSSLGRIAHGGQTNCSDNMSLEETGGFGCRTEQASRCKCLILVNRLHRIKGPWMWRRPSLPTHSCFSSSQPASFQRSPRRREAWGASFSSSFPTAKQRLLWKASTEAEASPPSFWFSVFQSHRQIEGLIWMSAVKLLIPMIKRRKSSITRITCYFLQPNTPCVSSRFMLSEQSVLHEHFCL